MANITHTEECILRRNGNKSNWVAGCPRCDFNLEAIRLRRNPPPIASPGFKNFMHGMSIYFSHNRDDYEIKVFQGTRKNQV